MKVHFSPLVVVSAALALAILPISALAEISSAGVLDTAYDAYASAAGKWSSTIEAYAAKLFWLLALISMVWTFGIMALRKADINEFFVEFIRFTIFVGFFWWLLLNGPNFAISLIESLRKIGGDASAAASGATAPLPSPSGIVDIGFAIFAKIVDKSSVWTPFSSAVGVALSIIVLVVLALVAVNMLIVIISAWVLAYAGIFFLGFGGSRWTSDMAINYFRTVLAMASQLFTMVLLVGIAKAIIDGYYTRMSTDMNLSEIAAVMVVGIILLALVNKLPPLVGGLATGSGVGALGNGYGASEAVASMALAATAFSTAASAMTSVASNVIGAGSSVQEAFKKALDYENAATGQQDATRSNCQGDSCFDQGESGPAWAGGANGAGDTSTPSRQANSSAEGSTQPKTVNSNPSKGPSAENGSPSKSSMASIGAKATRIGIGTLGNLGAGIYDTAKGGIMDRVCNSTMGKVAATIKSSADRQAQDIASVRDNKNSLSAGSDNQVDRKAEVAAFQNRNSVQDDGNGSDKIG